jgi:hypothetical protein
MPIQKEHLAMTMWTGGRLECAVCHQSNDCSLLQSTNTFGGVSDLDTRLGGMARSATLQAIHHCRHCGYCAPDIRRTEEKASETIQGAVYRQIAEDRSLPELARHWLCWSQVAEAAGKPAEAGWAALSAAWACDDARRAEGAERCRLRAAASFEDVVRAGERFSPESDGDAAILADILRRCGRFDEARAYGSIEPKPETPELIAAGLAFQRFLCERGDRQPYSFHELERYRRSPEEWRPIRWWEIWRG